MTQKPSLGATGKFPEGRLNADDEGELRFAVARNLGDGLVHVDFGKPVAWLALPPKVARDLAAVLLKCAKEP